MLTYFPTPYPDELWYSVLCRYYVSTGIHESSIVKKELFGSRENIKMATLYPNASIHTVLSQLPKGTYDTKKIILNHTTFAYYTRMYQAEEKERMLNELAVGKGKTPTHLWRTIPKEGYSLRYCPECVKEDRASYGEPYYHVEHQIPLSSVCVRHGCRLKQIDIHNAKVSLNQKFYPLSQLDIDIQSEEEILDSELLVSQIVREYWKLPRSTGPTEGYNNLYQTLLNSGYLKICKQAGVIIDNEKLYDSLCEWYGGKMIELAFGNAVSTNMVNRIRKWEQLVPDRYILIQAMLGIQTSEIFNSAPIEDSLYRKLLRCIRDGKYQTLKSISEEMMISSSDVRILFKSYELYPTWRELPKRKERISKNGLLRCTVDEKELEKIRIFARKMGYQSEGPFALDCVRYIMEQSSE